MGKRFDAVDEERPIRLLARYLTDYLFAAGDRWIVLTGGDPLDTLIVRTVFASNLGHLPYRDGERWHGLCAEVDDQRPVAINAVAQSLGVPFETVRLRVKALREAGVLDRPAQGLTALAAVRGNPRFAGLLMAEATALRGFVLTIARDAYDPEGQLSEAARALDIMPDDVAARMALDFNLRCAEQFVPLHGGLQAGIIATALVAANTRHILEDVALGKRFAFHQTPPPDTLRMPVTIRALHRDLGMPFETVRRQIHALAKRGVAEQHGDGWIVPARWLASDEVGRLNARNVQQLMRMAESAVRLVSA